MPVRIRTFVPLEEVPSSFLNTMQEHIYEQRGDGASNTLPAAMATQAPGSRRAVAVAMGLGPTTPPLMGGMLDSSIDYRDRRLAYSLKLHTTIDIRPTAITHGTQAEYHYKGEIYVSTSGGSIPLVGTAIDSYYLEIYVDPLTGALGLRKNIGYLWGEIKATSNYKVP